MFNKRCDIYLKGYSLSSFYTIWRSV